MNKSEYRRMADFEKEYWWHQGRLYLLKELITKYFPNRNNLNILEVGCGTGETTKYLTNFGHVVGIDESDEAIKFCKQNEIENVYELDINKVDSEEFAQKYGRFDLVVTLDVLEHIQDDVKAMNKIKSLLKDDGVFIATVPAHKFLWSEHDESLHHKRRYHSHEITQKLSDVGFKVLKKSYFIITMFAPIVFYRFVGNITGKSTYPKTSYVLLPKLLNNLMLNILKVESKIVSRTNFPIGVTIVVVSKKDR